MYFPAGTNLPASHACGVAVDVGAMIGTNVAVAVVVGLGVAVAVVVGLGIAVAVAVNVGIAVTAGMAVGVAAELDLNMLAPRARPKTIKMPADTTPIVRLFAKALRRILMLSPPFSYSLFRERLARIQVPPRKI